MPNIQIKNVSPATHAVLRKRASAAHQSLQEYLLAKLTEEAAQPTTDEVLARLSARAGNSAAPELRLDDVVNAVRSDRAGH